jgi:HAD domain in Swiss Army Knife RNA repair proteins
MNKLLFLDFDGVLHPTHFAGEDPFNRVHLLEEALAGSDLGIVISSSWRFTHSLKKLQKLLPGSISNLIIGVTGAPVIGKHPRYQEIQNFLQTHEASSWRALDDSYWEFPSPCPELIRCNPNTGISEKQIQELRQWVVA